MSHIVVFGGQYGSEGKASAAEFLAKKLRAEHKDSKLFVVGENGPNSGHTSSKGSTKNIPASSYWADIVLLGPDTVVDYEALVKDQKAVGKPVYVHEHAACLDPALKVEEADVVARISSTGSGTGIARVEKFFKRKPSAIVGDHLFTLQDIHVVSDEEYWNLICQMASNIAIFECSQGLLLDTNFGRFPYVTTRSTLPRVAVERNGLGHIPWSYFGVFRTYPIRTGGPSGPCGGKELMWSDLGVGPEIATVTKRVRRVFEFDSAEFAKALRLARPDGFMFTFLDYLSINPEKAYEHERFLDWLRFKGADLITRKYPVYLSHKTGMFFEMKAHASWGDLGQAFEAGLRAGPPPWP